MNFKKPYLLGTSLLALAVIIGAFGAHGIKKMVTTDLLQTYQTGVTYHYYHAFGLLILGVVAQLNPSFKSKNIMYAFMVGILFFSFNCYLYTLTQIKTFAMIVPLGGVSFIVGWVLFIKEIYKEIK